MKRALDSILLGVTALLCLLALLPVGVSAKPLGAL